MFHTYVAVIYLGVAYVCNCFSSVFVCVSGAYLFQLFRTYVAIVSFGCFKSRFEVLCMLQCEPLATCHSCLLQLLGHRAWRGAAQQAWRGMGSVGEWRGRTLTVRAAGAGAGVVAIK